MRYNTVGWEADAATDKLIRVHQRAPVKLRSGLA